MADNKNLGGLYYTLGLDDSDFEKKMSSYAEKYGEGINLKVKFDTNDINQSIANVEKGLKVINLKIGLNGNDYERTNNKLQALQEKWSKFKEIKINVSDKATTEGVANIKKAVLDLIQELNNLQQVKLSPISPDALKTIKDITTELKKLDKILERLSNYNASRVGRASFDNARVDEIQARQRQNALIAQQRLTESQLRARLAQVRLDEATRRYNRNLGFLRNTLFDTSHLMQTFGGMAAGAFSVYAVQRFVKHLAEVRGEFEMQQVSLRAILQNASAADQIFEQLKTLSVISPYEFKELVSYAKQLSAFSIPISEIYETTKNLADVASGLGVDMSRIILAYGQIRSAAVLRGQELRQLTEAGIPVIDELIRKYAEMGKVMNASDIFDEISRRNVSFEMIKEIFEDMTKEGGKFYNMQEIQSQSLKGKIANLGDAFDIMFNSIGEANDGILKGTVDGIASLATNWRTVYDILKIVIATYGVYNLVAIATDAQNIKRIAIIQRLTAAKKALNAVSVNPASMIAGGLTIAVGALYAYNNYMKQIKQEMYDRIGAIAKEKETTQGLIEEYIALTKEGDSNNESLLRRTQILKELSQVEPKIAENLKEHKDNLAELNKELETYNTLANAKVMFSFLVNDGEGLFSNSLNKDLQALDELEIELKNKTLAIENFYNKFYTEFYRTMNNKTSETANQDLLSVSEGIQNEIDSILQSTLSQVDKINKIKSLVLENQEKNSLSKDQANFFSFMDDLDYDPVDFIRRENTMKEYDKRLALIQDRIKGVTDDIKRQTEVAGINIKENEDYIRSMVLSSVETVKGQHIALDYFGIDFDKSKENIVDEFEGWKKALYDIIGDTIPLKVETSMSQAIDEMRKEYKSFKTEMDKHEKLMIKVGYDFSTDTIPEGLDAWTANAAKDFQKNAIDAKKLEKAASVFGFSLEDEKKKKKAEKSKDALAEKYKKEIELVKEAYSEYKKLQSVMSDIDAMSNIKDIERYAKVDVPYNDEQLLDSLQAMYDKVKKRQTDEGKKLAESLSKEIGKITTDNIKETLQKSFAQLEKELSSFKDKYNLYESFINAGAEKEQAIQIAFGDKNTEVDFAKFLESKMKEMAKLSGFELTFNIDKGNIIDQIGSVYDTLTPELKKQVDELEKYRVKKMENSFLSYLKIMNTDVPEGNGITFDFTRITSKLQNEIFKIKTELAEALADTTGVLSENQIDEVNEVTSKMIDAQNKIAENKVKNIGSNYLEENLKNKQLWNDYKRLSESSYGNVKKMIEEIAKMQEETISESGLTKIFEGSKLIGKKATQDNNEAFKPILDMLGENTSIEDLESQVIGMLQNINDAKEGNVAIDERMAHLTDEQILQLKLVLTLIQSMSQSLRGAEMNLKIADFNRTMKSLKELDKEVKTFTSSLKDVADAFGFAFSESTTDILDAVSVVASTSIEVISTLTTLARDAGLAMTATALMTTATIKTIEKASAVLTMISAAMQIATAVANIFTKNKTRRTDNQIKGYTEDLKELQREYSKLEKTQNRKYTLQADQSSIDRWLEREKKSIKESSRGWMLWSKVGREYVQSLYDEAEGKANSMKGTSWFAVEMEVLKQQQESLNRSIRAAQGDNKKGKRNDEIQGYKDQIKDIEVQMEDLRAEFYDMLRGFDMKSAANDFAESWVDAFLQGESAMDDFREHFDDMLKQMVVNQAALRVASNVLEPFFKQIDSFFGDDGVLNADEAGKIAQSIPDLMENLDESMNLVIKPLLDAMGLTYGSKADGKNTLSNGIKGITEDTASLLASLLNAIRQDVSVQTSILQSILNNLGGGMTDNNSSLMLAEMQEMNAKLTTIIANLASVTKSGHAKGGSGIKVFM